MGGDLFHWERVWTLKFSAWIALGFLGARALANRATAGRLEAYRAKRGIKVSVDKLQEEIWLVACGAVLSALSGCLLAYGPTFARGCNLLDTSECYSNVGSSDVPQEIALYYLTEVGWYLSLILKSLAGVGRGDSFVMEFHHVVTLALVIWSYVTGFTQAIGVVTFFVFNQSNPLLHFSKLANYAEMTRARCVLFILFAAVFFVSRVVILPAVVIRSTLFEMPLAATPEEWSGAVVYTWYTTNALLLALWALNVWWLRPIVRVIARNVSGVDQGRPQDDTVTRDGKPSEPAAAAKGYKKKN